MKLTVKSLHAALGTVLEIDPEARYRFVNHGSGTYSLDFKINPSRVGDVEFEALRALGVSEECDEDDSHEERVRNLGMILDDEFRAHVLEHETRMRRR